MEPGYDDSQWSKAIIVPKPPGVLSSQLIQPVKKIEAYTPVALTQPLPGVYVFDVGQNMAGWCKMTVSGSRGTTVCILILYPSLLDDMCFPP